VPGSIGATPIEAPVDIEEGLPVEVPLVYFYGHTTPSDHPELYKALVDRLGQLLDDRAKSSPQVHAEQPADGTHEPVCPERHLSFYACKLIFLIGMPTLVFACVPSCLAELQ